MPWRARSQSNTKRIAIGTAIVPVSTRTPALHAMSMSTLAHLAPGRCIVGFGISTSPIIEGWHGQPGVVERADELILNFAPRSAHAAEVADEPGAVVLPIRIATGHDLHDAGRRFRRESASYLRVPAYTKARAQGVSPLLVPIVAPGDLKDFERIMCAAVT